MPTIRYSIIIPHKDIPDLLNRLLRSIPKREDIKIFVVDDNSDPKIMADYQELENVNYRYTHESCGAEYARNIALREARGEWLLFADADDYFLPGAFDPFDYHATDEADIIYFKCEEDD